MARVDYSASAAPYRRARTLPPQVLERWDDAVGSLDLPDAGRVLDVGAGPGGFLEPLARWSGADVVAVEPSAAMRRAAASAGLHARFPWVAADAERLPLAADSADWVWLSAVVHQLDHPGAAAVEFARVLRPGGCVLVRGFFADVPVGGLFRTFPGIERAAAGFPTTEGVVSGFTDGGLGLASIVDVVEPWSFDRAGWVAGVRRLRHTDSLLRRLTDDEIEAGLRAVGAVGVVGGGGGSDTLAHPVTLRLVVLSRRG